MGGVGRGWMTASAGELMSGVPPHRDKQLCQELVHWPSTGPALAHRYKQKAEKDAIPRRAAAGMIGAGRR